MPILMFHAPVQVYKNEFAFPPNTLYRLKSVQESFVAPTGIHVHQRLLTVTATYRAPRLCDGDNDAALGSKLCAPATLSYADKASYIEGLDDILVAPSLTMAMEFARDKEWTSKQEYKDQFELTVQKHFSTSSDADIAPVLEKMTLAIANGEPLKVLAQHASQHKSVMMRALI